MARNLEALVPLVRELGPALIAFCTDDRDPDDIVDDGHINGMVRKAVAAGVKPADAIVCATRNPAVWHGLHHLGAVAPGYQADLLLLPDLDSFQPELVLKAGRRVGEIARPDVPEWVRQSVRIAPLRKDALTVPKYDRVRAIGLVPDQVVTESLVEAPTVRDGEAVADADRDLAKIAVLERHLGTGRMGIGLVRGFGLKRGALGSTVAHDAHNLVVVGMNDADLARVVERLAELGGGIVAVNDGAVLAELPLPVGGLLADLPLAEVVERSASCTAVAEQLGCTGSTPFLTMSFLALSVIPSLKITDQGLVDVDRFELVPLEAE